MATFLKHNGYSYGPVHRSVFAIHTRMCLLGIYMKFLSLFGISGQQISIKV